MKLANIEKCPKFMHCLTLDGNVNECTYKLEEVDESSLQAFIYWLEHDFGDALDEEFSSGIASYELVRLWCFAHDYKIHSL